MFSLQRLFSHSAIAYSHGHVFPCTLTFSKYLSLGQKLSFLRWGWQHQRIQNWFTCEGRKRKALHAVFTAASQFYPQGLSPPVQCQASISTSYCNGSCTFLPLHLCNFFARQLIWFCPNVVVEPGKNQLRGDSMAWRRVTPALRKTGLGIACTQAFNWTPDQVHKTQVSRHSGKSEQYAFHQIMLMLSASAWETVT